MSTVTPKLAHPPHWQGQVDEYITTIAWSSDGQTLMIGDASGAIHRFDVTTLELVCLQPGQGQSVDCLEFSHDGQLLATAGQDGYVRIWQMPPAPIAPELRLVATLANGSTWIDRIAWHPKTHQLAFQCGFEVQIWDAISNVDAVSQTLQLDATAQDIQWHPQGNLLAIAAQNRIRIWPWPIGPEQPALSLAAPVTAIAWSPEGEFLAAANLDHTLVVWPWGNDSPWQMRGFPGKVRQLTWSPPPLQVLPSTHQAPPRLVVTSLEGIIIWKKDEDSTIGWQGHVLEGHRARVEAIAFQPDTFVLASASQDGLVALWRGAPPIAVELARSGAGFSGLAWHPDGDYLAVGSQAGELLIWRSADLGGADSRTSS